MKKSTSIIPFIAIVAILFSFKKEPPKEHEYVVKGNLQQFVFINNYLSKTQEMLKRTSSLPSAVLAPELDTISMVQNLITVQVQAQIIEFQKADKKEDSIKNLKNDKK